MEYPKINSLWKREGFYYKQESQELKKYVTGSDRMALIPGDYACPEFENIRQWSVEEKVDGTNIRIYWERLIQGGPITVRFHGRTSAAQIPCHLLEYLQETFTAAKFETLQADLLPVKGTLYGEGYGPKIQACGGNYRKEPGFILYDVMMAGWWLKREDVKITSEKLLIPMVPQLGVKCEGDIIEYVKSKPLSLCSECPQMMEGVICRPDPLMLFRNGNPIIWKLKCREFQ